MFHRRVHALVVGVVLLAIATLDGDRHRARPDRVDPATPGRSLAGLDDRHPHGVVDRRGQGGELPRDGRRDGAAAPGDRRRARPPSALAAGGRVPRRRRHVRAVHRAVEGADRPAPASGSADPARNSASFPSGHAIAASVTALGLVVVLVPPGRRRTRWTVAAALFAATMAMARTYLAAHWASDVVAGAAIGTGLAAWSSPAALELVRARVRRRSS